MPQDASRRAVLVQDIRGQHLSRRSQAALHRISSYVEVISYPEILSKSEQQSTGGIIHISIIGAAGTVGSQITAEALSRGHQVDAYTRSGRTTDLTATQPLALTDTDAVAQVINSSDATVITVGGRDDYEAVVAAHQRLIAARPTGRLLVVGGAGALPVGEGRLLDSPEFPAEYLTEAKAFARVYDAYAAAHGLNWTMIAPSPVIAPGVRTGHYVDGGNGLAGGFVSSQDFAVAAVDELEKPAHSGERFSVASADETAARA